MGHHLHWTSTRVATTCNAMVNIGATTISLPLNSTYCRGYIFATQVSRSRRSFNWDTFANFFEGKGDQTALKSWWPLQTTWEKETTLANHGYWTEYNET